MRARSWPKRPRSKLWSKRCSKRCTMLRASRVARRKPGAGLPGCRTAGPPDRYKSILPLPAFITPRLSLPPNRRFFEPRVCLVERRDFSVLPALRINSARRSRASRGSAPGCGIAGLDDHHAPPGSDAAVAQRQQTLLVERRQGKDLAVEAQEHGAGDLVDVMPAHALRTDGGQLDSVAGQMDAIGNNPHATCLGQIEPQR